MAWLMPNDATATIKNLDKFLVKPAQMELKSKVKLPEVPKAWRIKKPKSSWALPAGCAPG